MADWSKPALTDTYADFRQFLSDRLDDAAKGNDPAVVTVTAPPTNMIRWTSASNKLQKYNGTTWVDLSSNYAINISGNAASAATASAAPWSGITGKPTTVAGYSITDAITTAGGQSINGNLTLNGGDMWAYRAGGTTGVVYLNNGGSRYLYNDGSNYQLPNGEVFANGYQLARLSSPAFSGTPSAPTAAAGTNSTQLATTAFVRAAETRNISGKAGVTKTLSTSAASGGSDGDIWYRY